MDVLESSRVGVIGLGHIGGSLAALLAQSGSVVGFDTDPVACRRLRTRWRVPIAASLRALVAETDLVVVATPTPIVPEVMGAVVAEAAKYPLRRVICDVASIKNSSLKSTSNVGIVGLHPMAGREGTGAESADSRLFEGSHWAAVFDPGTPGWAIERALWLSVRKCGAPTLCLTPELHNRVIAAVSDLPHVVALALAGSVGGSQHASLCRVLAAGSYRDGTRVARGDPARVKELLYPNRVELVEAIDGFRTVLDGLYTALATGDEADVASCVAAGVEAAKRTQRGIFDTSGEERVDEGELGRVVVSRGLEGWSVASISRLQPGYQVGFVRDGGS
ncbi:MAG: prephenate dehydrogenase [Ferrimicrobium sp.]